MTATGPLNETTSRGVTPVPEDRSIGELFSAISADLSNLIRQELALAKAEIRQSATRASVGAGMLGGAGYAAGMVLLFLSIAAWWGIGQWTGNAWSGVIVAVVWAIVAAILYAVGRSKLRQVEGVPQTTETAKKIPSALAGNEESR